MISEERESEIRSRCESATPGPWEWDRPWEKDSHHHAYDGGVGCLDSKTDTILWYGGDGEEDIYCPKKENAEFILNARIDIKDLLEALDATRAEVERLKFELELAIAHDRQPYPTAEAYELACKERNHLRDENRVLREALEKIADPRKRDHKEPDAYTTLGCVMNIAEDTLEKLNARFGEG